MKAYRVLSREFSSLKAARKYATADHGRDIERYVGGKWEMLLQYHPVSERLERVNDERRTIAER